MNNFNSNWSVLKFNSQEDAKKYCLSKLCDEYISYLDGLAHSLYEIGLTEPCIQSGHGYPREPWKITESNYVSAESDRLKNLRRYFKGEPPTDGYVWKYTLHELHYVTQEIDTSNLSKKHPAFINYCKSAGRKLSKTEINDAYKLWKSQFKCCESDNSFNRMSLQFKLAYHFRVKDIIPEGCKLISELL